MPLLLPASGAPGASADRLAASPPLRRVALAVAALVALTAAVALPSVIAVPVALGQPARAVARTYVPADQLVSFQPTVSLDQFIATLDPVFRRVTGRGVVDPEARMTPIGVSVQGMHFFDAFVYVLAANRLAYRENDRYFVVEALDAAAAADAVAAAAAAPPTTAVAGTGTPAALAPTRPSAPPRPAGLEGVGADTREIRINAVLFDLNVTKARETGLNWAAILGGSGGGSGGSGGASGGGGGAAGGDAASGLSLGLKTGDFFDLFRGRVFGPEQISFSTLVQFFRALESEGVGRTVANPSVTVRSGVKGRVQIGSDIPIFTRDFQGNTQTQLVSTGTIVEVTPTLFSEPADTTEGSPILNVIHLNVSLDKSTPRLFNGATSFDRNNATTQVMLLDGEQTLIGGLYSVERTRSRSGIRYLKDLPILGRIFGFEQTLDSQRELLMVIQAELVDPLAERQQRGLTPADVLRERREEVRRRLDGVTPGMGARAVFLDDKK